VHFAASRREATMWAPAWNTDAERADGVELFRLPRREIVPSENWPDGFWPHVGERRRLSEAEVARTIRLFCALELGTSARCHMPHWGLALYRGEELLLTATLCYQCNNAYVSTAEGTELRAFDARDATAYELRSVLERHLGITA
jgi:hypothetical protein